MNGKERIEAIIAGKEVDRTPFAILDGGAWAETTTGLTYREFLALEDAGASVIVEYFDKVNADMVSACGAFAGGYLDALGNKMQIDVVNTTVSSKRFINDIEEQVPELDKSIIREQLDENWVWQRLLHQVREIKKLVGDEKLISACVAGPFTCAGTLVGVQDLMIMLADEDMEDELNHLLDYTIEACSLAYEDLHEAGVDVAWFGEPVGSGAMISLDMFQEFAQEPIQKVHDRLRNTYKYIFMHMCGNSGSRVPIIKEMGFDAFSVDYMVDMEQAGADGGDDFVIIGNVNPTATLKDGTPEKVEAEAQAAVDKIKAGGGKVILCPGCDIPIGTAIENVQAIEKVARKN